MTQSNEDAKQQVQDRILATAHKFEYGVVLALIAAIGVICFIALIRLFFGIFDTLFLSWDLANYRAVPLLFGMVMTVLIALEFGNSILKHLHERSTIIQAREVILIGMMAVVRKIIIVDLATTPPLVIGALGIVAVALASAFWLMRGT